jgi:hypothetical protein
MANSSDSEWQSLLSTPAAVVRYLRKEPLLLAGMGAAVLIAIVAVFAPGGGAVFAYVIAGVVFAACVLWAVNGALRQRAEARAAERDRPRLPGTDFVAGGRSTVRDVRMSRRPAGPTSRAWSCAPTPFPSHARPASRHRRRMGRHRRRMGRCRCRMGRCRCGTRWRR